MGVFKKKINRWVSFPNSIPIIIKFGIIYFQFPSVAQQTINHYNLELQRFFFCKTEVLRPAANLEFRFPRFFKFQKVSFLFYKLEGLIGWMVSEIEKRLDEMSIYLFLAWIKKLCIYNNKYIVVYLFIISLLILIDELMMIIIVLFCSK